MSTKEKVVRRKLSLLDLAKELNNVSKFASASVTTVSHSAKSNVTIRPMGLWAAPQ
ncbi:hypothetical protein I6L46_05295 [Aeromonas sp. FDAARGOS 1416]|nr:hypothetical protein I6L46_05295 [Aeromonas sp. FDAARGOS 1416]